MTTYALNGLGRIGKLALKPLLERGTRIAWINDAVGDPAMHAHLLEFDTVHGRWQAEFAHDSDSVTVDGMRLPFVGTRDLSALPLKGIDVVIDCTGVFKTEASLAPYFDAGKEGRRLCPGEGRFDRKHRLWRQPRDLRPADQPDHHGRVLHDKLPRTCGEGDP